MLYLYSDGNPFLEIYSPVTLELSQEKDSENKPPLIANKQTNNTYILNSLLFPMVSRISVDKERPNDTRKRTEEKRK